MKTLNVNSLLVMTVLCASIAPAAATEREIQFRSVDFTTKIIELHNFGASDQSLNGWRLCSHSDDDGEFNYTTSTGFNGFTIEAGTSMFLWVDNDGPLDSDNVNINQLGGANDFASNLDQDAYSIGLYWPNGGSVQFFLGDDMADHMQWNIGGLDNTQADGRSSLAASANLWTDADLWISTTATTARIELNDLTGSELHGPSDFDVIEPSPADFDGSGIVDGGDLAFWEAAYNTNSTADADGDGDSDGQDFLIWQQEVAAAPLAAISAIPEPNSISLILLGALAVFCRRK